MQQDIESASLRSTSFDALLRRYAPEIPHMG
jgi:hypothetical protein